MLKILDAKKDNAVNVGVKPDTFVCGESKYMLFFMQVDYGKNFFFIFLFHWRPIRAWQVWGRHIALNSFDVSKWQFISDIITETVLFHAEFRSPASITIIWIFFCSIYVKQQVLIYVALTI